MKNIRFLFSVAMIVGMLTGFNFNTAMAQQTREHILLLKAQVEPQAAAYLKLGDIKGESNVKEGRNNVGTNTRTGDQIIVIISGGRISEVGVQSKGRYSPIQQSRAAACASPRCVGATQCYTLPTGECFCLCDPIKFEPPRGK